MCGERFPPTPVNPSPGVDAAHILPWREYELDDVCNGLCLCKLHHWAFDEGLIRIDHAAGQYETIVLDETRDIVLRHDPSFSMDVLIQATGPIPQDRLPVDRRQWPRPDFLQALGQYL